MGERVVAAEQGFTEHLPPTHGQISLRWHEGGATQGSAPLRGLRKAGQGCAQVFGSQDTSHPRLVLCGKVLGSLGRAGLREVLLSILQHL